MNGRIYDPILHRFLQPDSQVQEPFNTQNYNRYGYCLNNPLKYTDISGEDFGLSFAIAIGISLAVYFGDAIINNKPITFQGIATTIVTTAASAGISFGIGGIAAGINNFYVRATFQALAHGTTQGGMAALQGGKFWSGFAAGSLSSIMSSAWTGGESFKVNEGVKTGSIVEGIGGANATNAVGTMFVGTISGGAGAALTGGNFWQGAVTGLIVSGLNHAMHAIQEKQDLDAFAKEKFGADYKTKYGVKSLKWGSQMPKKGIMTSDGLAKYNSNSEMITVGGGEAGGISIQGTTYISDDIAQYGNEFLEATIGHEFVHDYHNKIFNGNYNHRASEYAAYQYSINYMKNSSTLKMNVETYVKYQSMYSNGGNRYNKVPGLLP